MSKILNWINGWRLDLDGWWVRAKRARDPSLEDRPDIGFTEDACIAVRKPEYARWVDRGVL